MDYVRLVLSRHAKSDALKKTTDSKTQKVCMICTYFNLISALLFK